MSFFAFIATMLAIAIVSVCGLVLILFVITALAALMDVDGGIE